ncbi:MAG TPA: PIN domain nuclease [Terracidiphilus sp.]|nr:PIN domain nuclease [Terracidiphilus sp.]
MTIVDTSVLVAYLNGRIDSRTDWLHLNLGLRRLGITTLILSEVLQGVRTDKLFRETLRELERFAVFETAGRDLAVASAQNYRALRSKGITIRSLIDCFTATFCIEQGFELLHNDRDFDAFEQYFGLVVVDPSLRI